MDSHDDVRRWATERAVGLVRIALEIEPMMEDIRGAVANDDPDYAAYTARQVVLRAMSVISLCRGGPIDIDDSNPAADHLVNVPESVVSVGRTLATSFATARRPESVAVLEELELFVAGACAALGIGEIPQVRTSEGMFPALALTRDWVNLCAALGGPVAVVAPGS